MIEMIVFPAIFIAFSSFLAWAAYRQFAAKDTREQDARLPVEFLMPRKVQEYSEGQHRLAEIRTEMEKSALPAARKHCLVQERNKIARRLLTSLHEDFTRLDRLMCAVAVVSMEVSHEQEFRRFLLSVQFGIRYRIAIFCLSMGMLPAHSVARLQFLVKRSGQNVQTLLRAVDESLSLNLDSTHIH